MYLREIASVEALPLYREAARYRLTELNLWEVVRMARSFIGRGVPFLDLVQEGNLGLIQAVSEVPFGQGSFGERRDSRIREAIESAFG
jgi:RNA polymerase primary sigma factor